MMARGIRYLQLVESYWEDACYDGTWVRRTTTSLPPEQVALAYRGLWRVENALRTLKTPLEHGPPFHSSEAGIRGARASLRPRLRRRSPHRGSAGRRRPRPGRQGSPSAARRQPPPCARSRQKPPPRPTPCDNTKREPRHRREPSAEPSNMGLRWGQRATAASGPKTGSGSLPASATTTPGASCSHDGCGTTPGEPFEAPTSGSAM